MGIRIKRARLPAVTPCLYCPTLNEPVRAVHLLPDTHEAGAENQARYLIEGLQAEPEVDVGILYFGEGRAHKRFEALGVDRRKVPRHRRLAFDLPSRVRRVRAAYAGEEPDILHTWLVEGNLVGLIAARKWKSTRVIITQSGSWNELDYGLPIRLQKLFQGRADHAISNSPGGVEMLEHLGMDPARLSLVTNGIPASRVASDWHPNVRRENGWEDAELVVWTGRANDADTVRHKDLPTLLAGTAHARERRPRLILVIVGSSREQLTSAGLDIPEWVKPMGFQPSPVPFVQAADVFALSSRVEGASHSVGEALMLGAPVVSTDCGGHCEAVRAAGGRVVPVDNPAAFGDAIVEMLDNPPSRDAASAIGMRELSIERYVESTLEVYRRVLAAG